MDTNDTTGTSTTSTSADYLRLWPAPTIEITLSERTITDLRMIMFQLTDSLKSIFNNQSEKNENGNNK